MTFCSLDDDADRSIRPENADAVNARHGFADSRRRDGDGTSENHNAT